MKVILGLFVCFLFSSNVLSPKTEAQELSEADKFSIIESVLRNDVNFKGQILSASAENPVTIYFSSKNIMAALLPKLPHVSFVILEPDQLKLDQRDCLDYWEFMIFEFKDSKASVSLSRTTLTHRLAPVKEGIGYELEKTDGKWIGKIVSIFAT